MIILTTINTIAILIVFLKLKIFNTTIKRDETFWNKTLTGYDIWINKFHFRIPIRNKTKTKKREEIFIMLTYSKQNKLQSLSAKFSWLKTWDEVRQFEKDYLVVDREIVERLVTNFVPK